MNRPARDARKQSHPEEPIEVEAVATLRTGFQSIISIGYHFWSYKQ